MPSQRERLAQCVGYDSGNAADRLIFLMPGLPRSRHSATQIEPFDGIRKVAHEISPSQLAVGKNVEAEIFLPIQHVANVFVFKRSKLCGIVLRIATRR